MAAMLSRPFSSKPNSAAATNTQADLTRFKETFQPDAGNFSPGFPLVPPQPEPLRSWNYPFSYNTVYTPRSYENISFDELRALAENYDIVRLLIETRKDQIEKLEWQITAKGADFTEKDGPARAEKLEEFFQHPDGYQNFAGWLRELLEDLLVIDAPALEVRRNRANEIIGLDVLDGATFKVLLDYNGRTPRPPAPAYEQIIHGRPWALVQDGQRTTDEDADAVPFTDQELIYLPRNRRAHKAYGFSPVEQIIVTVNIGLRRQISQLHEFTDGNMPPGLLTAPAGWNADQIQQFQEWFDSITSGNLAARRKLMWGPDGAKYQRFIEPALKDDFDEWLARIACFAFSISPTPFTKTQNRGEQLATKEAALEEGLAPLMGWVKRLIDDVIQRRMGQRDLEFVWSDERPMDEVDKAKIIQDDFRTGLITLNEGRDLKGLEPVDGGDQIMFTTPSGPLLLSAVVGGTGLSTDTVDLAPGEAAAEARDPASDDTGAGEKPGAKPQPGNEANPKTDPNEGDDSNKTARATISQADAGYQNMPRAGEQCGNCRMFVQCSNSADLNRCALVRGDISAQGWCEYFDEAQASKAARMRDIRRAKHPRLRGVPGLNAALMGRNADEVNS
jgi:hypothetical protein